VSIQTEWRDYDVIVVGSGGAGSQAARAAAADGARVLVVSKDPIGCSDTKISEGIATVRESGSKDDSEATLSENLRMAGADLPLSKITDAFAKDSKTAYDQYRNQGLRPSIDAERGTPRALPLPMGGHNQRRSVGHENSGIAFSHANWRAIISSDSVDYLEDAWFLELVTDGEEDKKRIVGGLIYDAPRGVLVVARAPAVVIAAGGLSTLFFPKTDTMRGNTGDSYAVAMRAGADLVDMEQVQFLPFCLASPPSYEGLLAGEPSSASYLGVLRDKNGKVILDGVYLRTRAECSSAIMRAVADGRATPNGGAWLDMTANKKLPRSGPWFMRFIESSLPSAYKNARQAMPKSAGNCDEPWEVRPSAHYHMGGIRVNEHGASTGGAGDGELSRGVTGLYAAGQAMGGLFGANRLGSTSLTEGAVFGSRAGRAAAGLAAKQTDQADQSVFTSAITAVEHCFGRTGSKAAYPLKLALQNASWMCIGPVRTADKLREFNENLKQWTEQLDDVTIPDYAVWNQAFIEFVELRNMLEVAQAVAGSASERDCSVGGHVRLDCKDVSPLAQPFSTVVHRRAAQTGFDAPQVFRVSRTRTPALRAMIFKVTAKWRILQARGLRYMPAGVQDKILEKRYRTLMGGSGSAPAVQPGGPEAAIGEAEHA
jgi:fumarate reductase (CoM/CoB) subunit A